MSYASAVWLAVQEDLYNAGRNDVPRCYLENFDDRFLFQNFHFTRQSLQFITDLIKAALNNRASDRLNNTPMSDVAVLATLCFYAHGTLPRRITDMLGLSKVTAREAVNTVTKLLAGMTDKFITFPGSFNDRMGVASVIRSFSGIPNVVGVLGYLHVKVTPPQEDESLYLNSLDDHSVMTQVICDGEGNLLSVEQCCPGGTPEQQVWETSNISLQFNSFQHGQTWVVGGKGLYMSKHVLTALCDAELKTKAARRFNAAHSRALGCVLRTLGALKTRFRCLEHLGPVQTGALNHACQIVRACCVLHNVAKKFSVPLPGQPMPEPLLPAASPRGRSEGHELSEGEKIREDMIAMCFSHPSDRLDEGNGIRETENGEGRCSQSAL
ncbi:putative nuclease HARBI1 [Chanos chanos]|uniref:Putative nuclease HARBI1 n=1 Tax=Chanos chanos TaxID=29144 RepID=A0A6J2USY7_CHACN|nr:putative nuclease HARBI1 [Chanos chanos]